MNLYNFLDTLTYLSPIIAFIGAVGGVVFWNKLKRLKRYLVIYLCSAFLVDVISRVVSYYYGNNLFFIPLFGLLELIIFSLIFIHLIPSKWIGLICLPGLGYILYELVMINSSDIDHFQSYSRVVDSFILVVFGVVYYARKIIRDADLNKDEFQLVGAVLFYGALSLIYFLPINFFVNENTNFNLLFWLTYLVLNLLFYSYLTWKIWKNGKIRKQFLYGSPSS